jgi:hypothetical protein
MLHFFRFVSEVCVHTGNHILKISRLLFGDFWSCQFTKWELSTAGFVTLSLCDCYLQSVAEDWAVDKVVGAKKEELERTISKHAIASSSAWVQMRTDMSKSTPVL